MKADPAAQRRLLDLQAVDTTIAQLRHKRASIPELAQINDAQAERKVLSERVVAAKTRLYDYQQEQTKAESDLAPVRERRVRDQERLDSGVITDPKQLKSLLEEIENLDRRIVVLEDAELETMERVEAAQGAYDDLAERWKQSEPILRELVASRDEKASAIDAELKQATDERGIIAAAIPADLLKAYTKDLERSGIGAAELRHGRCTGCQLQLNPADLMGLRAAADDAVVRCEECNRILVRTSESGL